MPRTCSWNVRIVDLCWSNDGKVSLYRGVGVGEKVNFVRGRCTVIEMLLCEGATPLMDSEQELVCS